MTDQNESGELSPAARAALEAGIESAKTEPPRYLGRFAEYADCMESREEVTAQLERTELEIASAYELPLQSIREKLTSGELPESDLVRKWQEHYAAFRDWGSDDELLEKPE